MATLCVLCAAAMLCPPTSTEGITGDQWQVKSDVLRCVHATPRLEPVRTFYDDGSSPVSQGTTWRRSHDLLGGAEIVSDHQTGPGAVGKSAIPWTGMATYQVKGGPLQRIVQNFNVASRTTTTTTTSDENLDSTAQPAFMGLAADLRKLEGQTHPARPRMPPSKRMN